MRFEIKFIIISVSIFLFMFTGFSVQPIHSISKDTARSASGPPAGHFPEVKLPRGYENTAARPLRLKGQEIAIDLFSVKFAQGMAAYAEIYDNSGGNRDISVSRLSFNNHELLPVKRAWGYRCIFGIDPESVNAARNLAITYSVGGAARSESFSVPFSKTKFLFNPSPLDLGKYSDVDYRLTDEEIAFINRCSAKKKKAFGLTGADRLRASLSHPCGYHYVTSPFWAKRNIMRYRMKNGRKIRLANRLNIHRGVDLRGKSGDPVYSIGDGVVAISEPMYYEGNFIVIDHGNRIFSMYMHLNDMTIKEGDTVRAGDLIGHVGSTGLSTAAHLHVSVVIQNIYVDPLSMLALPVRD